jgi:hypothetical protein
VAKCTEHGTERPIGQPVDVKPRNSSSPEVFAAIVTTTAIAIVFGGQANQAIPGGPYISIFGHIIPGIAALVSIALALSFVRGARLHLLILAAPFMLISSFAIYQILASLLRFWLDPIARGMSFGI